MAVPTITGASHVAFTVTDLEQSLWWYREVLGAEMYLDERPGGRDAVILSLSGTSLLVALTTHETGEAGAFDPARTGLDHFAFSVADRDDLDDWAAHLEANGVEHSGAIDVPPGTILNFKDPDGIALALFWHR
ncbi:MAG: VOC family protein [Acidimicrobiales bacterium]